MSFSKSFLNQLQYSQSGQSASAFRTEKCGKAQLFAEHDSEGQLVGDAVNAEATNSSTICLGFPEGSIAVHVRVVTESASLKVAMFKLLTDLFQYLITTLFSA